MTTDAKDDDGAALKPRVIDLQAEDVTPTPEAPEPGTDKPDAPPPPPPPPPPSSRRRSSGGTLRWIVVALLAGAVAGGWLYRDLLSAYLPTNQTELLRLRVEAVETTTKTVAEQLATVAGTADAAHGLAQNLDGSVKDAAAAIAAVKSGVDDVASRIAGNEAAIASLRADLDSLRNAIAAGGSVQGGGPVDTAALAAIGQRLDALEKDVASLKGGRGTGDNAAGVAALSQSLSDMKAKIAAGTSYREEFDRLARMVPAAAGLEVLGAFATEGLPNPEGLAAELRADIPTLPKPEAEAPSADGGYLDSFWTAVTSVVTIRTIGETDWPALAGDCAGLAAVGDLSQAIARIDAVEGTIPAAVSRWRERAAGRLKLEAALAQLSEAVQRQIVSLGGGQ